jgi:hypothetical protein
MTISLFVAFSGILVSATEYEFVCNSCKRLIEGEM